MKLAFFQLVRFALVGSLNTVVDVAAYAILTRGITFFEQHYLLAAAISFCLAAVNSFFCNKHWTFRDRVHYSHSQFVRFYIVALTAMLLNQLLLWIFVTQGVYDIAAKILSGVLAGGVNFLLQKFLIFPVVQLSENAYTKEKI